MSNRGVDLELGRHRRRVAEVEGVDYQGYDKIQPESIKSHVDDGVEALVCSGVVHTTQLSASSAQGGEIPSALPHTNRDTPRGRLEL